MLTKLQLVLLRYMERLSNVTVGLDLDAGMQPIPYLLQKRADTADQRLLTVSFLQPSAAPSKHF